MANAIQRDPNRPGVSGLPRSSDDTPRNEQVDQFMGNMRARPETDVAAELAALRADNAELRGKLEEWEQLINGPEGIEATWSEKQREYEALLEEKSEVIRGLHVKIHELQEAKPEVQPEAKPATLPPENVDAAAKEVLELQRQLEEERQQLKEDEEALMKQMREMEMAMARDRAELARHRAELQRLHTDLNRELENASRDAGLRERLLALTRRPQEGGRNKTTAILPVVKTGEPKPAQPPGADAKKGNSGFFRRMFGG